MAHVGDAKLAQVNAAGDSLHAAKPVPQVEAAVQVSPGVGADGLDGAAVPSHA